MRIKGVIRMSSSGIDISLVDPEQGFLKLADNQFTKLISLAYESLIRGDQFDGLGYTIPVTNNYGNNPTSSLKIPCMFGFIMLTKYTYDFSGKPAQPDRCSLEINFDTGE